MEIGKNHVPIFTGDGPRSFEMLQKVMRFAQQMDCSGKRMEKPLKIVYIEQKRNLKLWKIHNIGSEKTIKICLISMNT